jgi:murein DD-endopeptidase MepM/ murein hydrolase activator NlpD
MPEDFEHSEPVPDYLADTGPIQTIRDDAPLPVWRRLAGVMSLLGAAALTVATALLLLNPGDPSTPAVGSPTVEVTPTDAALADTGSPEAPAPVVLPTSITTVDSADPSIDAAFLPTLNPDAISALLTTPVAPLAARTDGIRVVRDFYNPFTIIPDRPRSEVIEYEVQAGDTIFTIAERFGIKPETIAWSNDRSIIGGLRPGRMINILPLDGAYITVPAQLTIAQIAADFRVDPYAIIDSEYNDFFNAAPDTVLTSGTKVVVPGGQAEQIVWAPPVTRVGGDASQGNAGGKISFAAGEAGSCGLVDNPGGGGGWTNPMGGGYSWTQGYSSWHTGVDLAATPGTPVRAANGGTVIFSGWNSFGYGYTIVLAHGPFTTLYGHLSDINVGCGQYVSSGQLIGAVGSSGNSSGPHLHFEIRYNDSPQDPTYTITF